MKKIILGFILITVLTGCTQYKEIDGNNIIVEDTGQRVVDNILCKTSTTIEQRETLKQNQINTYNDKLSNNEITKEQYDQIMNDINESFNLDEVIECSEFNILSGKNSLWETIFVKPLAWILIQLGNLTTTYGLAIILTTILIRLCLYPITKKTAMQSENMQAARKKLTKVEEKYRNRTDQASQMAKSQETMKVYKEFNINPLSGCLYALIQIPLFFAFLETLYRLPLILEENFFGINLSITPISAIQNGQWYYLIFVILVVTATYFSFKLNATTNPVGEQQNQMKMMRNISVVMIAFGSLTVSTGIALYWITNSSFTIVQNLIVKKEKKNVNII